MRNVHSWIVGNVIVATAVVDDTWPEDEAIVDALHVYALQVSKRRIFDNGCTVGFKYEVRELTS